MRAMNPSKKKTGFAIYGTDRENEVSKIFRISLGSNKRGRFQFKQTFEFSGLYSEIRPAKLTNRCAHSN